MWNPLPIFLLQATNTEEIETLKHKLSMMTKANEKLKIEKAKVDARKTYDVIDKLKVKDSLKTSASNSHKSVGQIPQGKFSLNVVRT